MRPYESKPSSCLSNREENEIYSYTQNDLANRMARNAIDSKSALNLNGMQHSYPGVHTNFFYDFSATGKHSLPAERKAGRRGVRDACQFVGCLVFMAFNSIKLVCASSNCLFPFPYIYLSVYRTDCLIVAFRCLSLPLPPAEGRNKHKQRRTVFARFLQGLRQSGDELNATEGMQLKVSSAVESTNELSSEQPAAAELVAKHCAAGKKAGQD